MKLRYIIKFIPHWLEFYFLKYSPLHKRIPHLHVIGDSHSSFCFTNVVPMATSRENSILRYKQKNKTIKLPCSIHWLGPVTMFRVGRDNINLINLKTMKAKENDIVVFLFGEIDIRCHIEKQSNLQKRSSDIIIDEMVEKYISCIVDNKKQFNTLHCIVGTIVPPTDRAYSEKFPFYGSLETRIALTKKLNTKLHEHCAKHDLPILDLYTDYSTSKGDLKAELADRSVHIDSKHNFAIKKNLLKLLYPHSIK